MLCLSMCMCAWVSVCGYVCLRTCVCVCVCVWHIWWDYLCVCYNILQWISCRGGRTWSCDCDNQLTHENELQEGWMDKVAMGTQGFQQYWRCMADKMISYDSSRAKPTTGKISLWVMVTNFDRPAKLKSCVPIVTYSMGGHPCSLYPSPWNVVRMWCHVLPPRDIKFLQIT